MFGDDFRELCRTVMTFVTLKACFRFDMEPTDSILVCGAQSVLRAGCMVKSGRVV